MSKILNMTQHNASPEQIAAGVIEPAAEIKENIRKLLTFNSLPSCEEIKERAKALAEIAEDAGVGKVLIGGAPYLMAPLEAELIHRGILPLYAFSIREVVEETLPDGTIKKVTKFRHAGFVPACR